MLKQNPANPVEGETPGSGKNGGVCVRGGGVSLLPYPVLWCFADNLRSPKHMVAFRDWDRHSDPSLSLPSLTIFRFVSASFLAHSLA